MCRQFSCFPIRSLSLFLSLIRLVKNKILIFLFTFQIINFGLVDVHWVSSYSISFISILIFIIFFLLLDLGLDCSFFLES